MVENSLFLLIEMGVLDLLLSLRILGVSIGSSSTESLPRSVHVVPIFLLMIHQYFKQKGGYYGKY